MNENTSEQDGRFEKLGNFGKWTACTLALFFGLSIFMLFPPGFQIVMLGLGALVAAKVIVSRKSKKREQAMIDASRQEVITHQEDVTVDKYSAPYQETSKYAA